MQSKSKSLVGRILRDLWFYKETLIIIFIPILASWLVFGIGTKEARCGFCIFVMAVYWMFEVLPLPVTALMPIFLFPMLGILPSQQVCSNYLTDTNFLFFGGLIVALAIEKSNLHTRIALKVLSVVGSEPYWIMLGFMSATAFISMWISNTAACAMMVPIAQSVTLQLLNVHKYRRMPDNDGVLESLKKDDTKESMLSDSTKENNPVADAAFPMQNLSSADSPKQLPDDYDTSSPPTVAAKDGTLLIDIEQLKAEDQNMVKSLLISICCAANIGGTATITGTPPNLVTVGQLNEKLYPNVDTGITFASWMAFAILPMIMCLLACWLCLVLYFSGFKVIRLLFRKLCCCCCKKRRKTSHSDVIAQVIHQQYLNLPSWSFAEMEVSICFLLLLILWIFREPGTFRGFGSYFQYNQTNYFTDATSAVIVAFLLFVLPCELPDFLCFRHRDNKSKAPCKRSSLMDWQTMLAKFPWGVIVLVGGGFALAAGVKASGLSVWLGNQLAAVGQLHVVLLQTTCVVLTMCVTAVTSNVVTASILVPIVNSLALDACINPLALVLPTAIAASFAFVLPVSTPPNAIVFASGLLKVRDMFLSGLLISLSTAFILILSMQSFVRLVFPLDRFPEWASKMGPHCNQTAGALNSTLLL